MATGLLIDLFFFSFVTCTGSGFLLDVDELALNEVLLSFTVASSTPAELCTSCSKTVTSYSSGFVARSTGSGSLLDSDEPSSVALIKVLLCLPFATILSMALSIRSLGACFVPSLNRIFLVTCVIFCPGFDELVANKALFWNPFVFDFSVCGMALRGPAADTRSTRARLRSRAAAAAVAGGGGTAAVTPACRGPPAGEEGWAGSRRPTRRTTRGGEPSLGPPARSSTDAAASAPASGSIVLELIPLATSPFADSLTFANFLLAFAKFDDKILEPLLVNPHIHAS